MSSELHIETKSPEEKALDIESKTLEIEKSRVALRNDRLGVEKTRAELEKARMDLLNQTLKEGRMLHLGVARLSGVVDEDTVEKARTELYHLSKTRPGEQIILDINSPGGAVDNGMELYGIVRELSKAGHLMVTRISGHACSMGGVIAQAGDRRLIREGSYLHLHEASWGAIGKANEMREAAERVEMISKDISKIYAKRSVLSAADIYERFHRREWYMGADEALEVGFVDEIV